MYYLKPEYARKKTFTQNITLFLQQQHITHEIANIENETTNDTIATIYGIGIVASPACVAAVVDCCVVVDRCIVVANS
jgi:hypothetical protein